MKILIEDKFLKIIDKENLRTGNVNSYKMSIEYDSFYNDRVLMIYFKQDDIKKIVTVGPDNIIDIPHEVLENVRDIYIGFYSPSPDGDKLKDRYCSNFDRLTVIEGAYDEDATPTEELTPTILEKYLQEMKDFYNESLKEYNDNADLKLSEYNNNSSQKVREYNENAHLKKEEIDKVADEVSKEKSDIEEMKKSIETSEINAKTSEANAKTSEQNAQKSAENASKILTNVTGIQTNINETKGQIDTIKEDIDAKAGQVNTAVEEATNQANISKEQADISITNAGKTSTDRTAIGNMKNDVSSMKSSVEQTKTDIQGIYNDTVYAKDETLQAKAEVENSLENERIESDKKYARAIESDTITIKNFGQVECDENGYMKDIEIESTLPEITQDVTETSPSLDYPSEFKNTLSSFNIKNTVDEVEKYDKQIVLPENNFLGTFSGYKNYIKDSKLKSNLKIITLDGTEKYTIKSINTNTIRFKMDLSLDTNIVLDNTNLNYLCNYLKAYKYNERTEDKEGIFIGVTTSSIEIYMRVSLNEIASIDEFKEFLSSKAITEEPFKILLQCGEEETLLDDINLALYQGVNNISAENLKLNFKYNMKLISEKTANSRYPRALKTKVEDIEQAQIYAENDVVDDLIINGVELTQVVTENSPSLDNPSEIQIASEQNIQICKNNYLNTTQIANENFSNGGLTVATDENGIFTVNGTHSEQVNINFTNLNFNIKENQVIKLIPLGGNVNYQGNIFNCINSILWNKEWKTLTFLNLNSSLITSSDTVKYFQVRFIIPVQQSSITYTNFKFGIMVINADDNIQDYHPYYGTNITIPLVNSAIGQYADTIDRENNVQNKVIQELTLTGDENWNAAGSNDVTNVFSINLNYSVENYTGLCNFLKTGVSGNVEKFTPLGTSLYIAVNKTRASTVEEFKALLAQLYSSGNPLKVYLVRVSPTKNPLSEEVQTALSNLKLYQDLNNIAIDGGSMNFIYNKSLLRSLEEKDEKIDGLQSQIDEIKSLLSSTSTASLLAENLAKDNESEVI